ncbi:MAG TPA: hypothetical protein VGQ09_05240 [Chitinophagaceae bacterium]|nr:hypothetical protein [Chitinophagaceae bacterium]
MRRIINLIFFFLPFLGFSQTNRNPISASYLGLGAYSNNHIDVFSFHANQAALAKTKDVSAGIYGEKRFLLKELSLYDASVALPTHSGNFGFDARYYGFADYNETQLGLAYAKNLGSKVDVGVQFNYYAIRVEGYGTASTFNFEVGTILHLTEKMNAGVHVYNPIGGKLGKNEEEKLASLYSAGIGFEASQEFFTSIEIEKEEDKPVNINAGLQYKFLPQLLARGGVSTATSSMYLGVGLYWRSMRLDAIASYHTQLGITPGLVLIFNLNKKGS